MIIFKEKDYSRRDENLEWSAEITGIDIQRSRTFELDYNDPSMVSYRHIIKNLIKDIKSKYVYSDGPNGGDTHYLSDFSKPNRFLVYSKIINIDDRLNYAVYEPDNAGITKVVLMRCKGHSLLGRRGYSEK